MSRKKAFAVLNRLLHPPVPVLLFVPPVVFAALVYVFVTGLSGGAPAYVVYGLSAYCLVILVLPLPKSVRNIKAAIVRRITGTAFGARYMNDLAFRGSIGVYRGMAVNFLHVAFRIAVGVRYESVWFISVAVYYLVLGVLRLLLISGCRRGNGIGGARCYRRTTWLLFLLNIPMGGMILLMVLTDSGYSYPGYVIYISAMYTFYALACAIINLVRFRRLGSPVLSAAKVLDFIAAMMSVLGLQTAMISRFSAESGGSRRVMNAVTGGVVWVLVILTAVYMLHRSKRIKDEVSPDKQIRK